MDRHPEERQLDFLLAPFVMEADWRDQNDAMERPFFSLSKTKRLKAIDYCSPDGSKWVKVEPHQNYGMATIWDADVLIWAVSVMTAAKNRQANHIPRTLQFQPHELLRAIGRGTGGADYERLRAGLERLATTVVRTNIRVKGGRKERIFNWLEGVEDFVDEDTRQSRGMAITVADWLHEGVENGDVLTINKAYFKLTGGRERWLYRVARKHAGGAGPDGVAISLPVLFVKSGAEGAYKRFKHELKRIAERDELPEFALEWEEMKDRDPLLRMLRRPAATGS